MLPNNGGKFCNNCQKTVIDFTELSNHKILDILSSSSQKVCGRFTHVQLMVLNQQIVPQQCSSLFSWQKLSLAAAFIAALPFVNVQAKVRPAVEQNPVKQDKAVLATDTSVAYKTITGCLTAKDDNMPLIGAYIKIKGTSLNCSTQTDGAFSMKIPANKKLILVISYIGFKTQEIKFDPNKKLDFNIRLESANTMLGEVVVTSY
ncbi:MAG: carboxypeptidase-like regulatory domain-containing protein [Mucilaginibacter sp.]